jgi:NADH-quinone oxidoreductase subunit N
VDYLELLKLAAPEAIIVVTALVVLALALIGRRAASLCSTIALLGIAIAVGAIRMLPHDAIISGGMLVICPLNSLFKIICLLLAISAILLTISERALPHRGEFLAIILFATVGLLLLVSSEELLMIFIGLELLGLSLYILAAFDKTDLRSAEAGLKYFLFGSTASAFTLFGLSLVYGTTGTTSLDLIARNLSATPLLAAGVVMTLIGFAFKIAAAPFHLWAPDAYQGAPIPSAAFIASASKVASFVVLGKIVLIGFGPLHGSADWHAMIAGWSPLLAVLSALSILLGNLVALAQTNVRRLLAYSAVAHAGYTLLGIIAADRQGFAATLFYITVYGITLLGAFGVCAEVQQQTGGDDLKNFVGLRERSPILAACMAIFMLSLAGLPPLAGFFGKFYLFTAAFRGGPNHGLLWLVVLALFGSLISLYYYLIVLKAIFVDRQSHPTQPLNLSTSQPLFQSLTIIALAAVVLLLGAIPTALVDPIARSLPQFTAAKTSPSCHSATHSSLPPGASAPPSVN